jgi:hypothetical protein
VRLSANTGICVDLKGGEHEAEREHLHLWDLRGSECEAEREAESRPQGNGGPYSRRASKHFSPTARTPIAYAVWKHD